MSLSADRRCMTCDHVWTGSTLCPVCQLVPYYAEDGIAIYHGDCLDVLPRLSGQFDLLLTDPPYGIREAAGKNASRGNLAVSRDYGNERWDDKPAHEAVALARSVCRWQVIFGGNYYNLPPSSCWLVWDKENGANDFADCELAWTNLRKAVRKLTYRWNGMLQEPGMRKEIRQHPTQKPEAVIRWALMQAPQDVRTGGDRENEVDFNERRANLPSLHSSAELA